MLDPKLLTNPDRILFPQSGITKKELGDYYGAIAPLMLPFLIDRPLSMQRWPEGIDGEGFYQKDIPDYFPQWIERFPVTNSDGTKTTYVIANNKETLIYLAYQACITPHVWLSKIDTPNYPDRIIFDLDPGEKTTFDIVRQTALLLKELLDSINLPSYPMTTGSRGIHITIPITPTQNFDEVSAYARRIAEILTAHNPNELTTEIRKDKREGRLFVDWLRNLYGHTAAPPYAVRGKEGAPVATPLHWKEVKDPKLTAQSYTIQNIFKRIEKIGNAWEGFDAARVTLKKTTEKS